ncbi:NADH dehydrogenase [ubiquinone] 1 beta subcomplex subunit 3-B-like [Silene latifolia]|uniref:NADH dehydrogenase [ubiquinone] 1 beta subcomplex subunit 3-B-like n=1 Tax=Silene latifolia TaxID=37657 RepID=UPI003D778E2A
MILRRREKEEEMEKQLGTTGEFFRRRDAWRKHPMLSNQFRHALPGFGLGVSAFCVYLVAETVYNKFYSPPPPPSHH